VIRLVAFDMDGTLVNVVSSWAEVHRYFGGTNDEAVRLFMEDKITDEEFLKSDIRIWWRHRPNLTLAELDHILARVPLMPGADALFRELRARGIETAIISGGIDVLARRVARDLGITHVFANGFRVDGQGRLTGEGIIRVPIKRKEEVLQRLQDTLGIPPEESASVGNSEIDVGLFRRSRVGVAFLPADDLVRRSATAIVTEPDLGRVLPYLVEDGGGPAPSAAEGARGPTF